MHTVESDPEHGVVLKQTLIWDISARRSRMIADGTLVGGHLEEIRSVARSSLMFCDLRFSKGIVAVVNNSCQASHPGG